MVLEIRDTVVGGETVPVDGDEVDLAARAPADEIREPVETRGSAAVADGWGTDFDFAAKGLHIGPCIDGFLRRHVGLSGKVGLVEGENVGGAVGDGGVDVVLPLGKVQVGGAPEHGDVVHR